MLIPLNDQQLKINNTFVLKMLSNIFETSPYFHTTSSSVENGRCV